MHAIYIYIWNKKVLFGVFVLKRSETCRLLLDLLFFEKLLSFIYYYSITFSLDSYLITQMLLAHLINNNCYCKEYKNLKTIVNIFYSIFLDFERSGKCIVFTMMCVYLYSFLFLMFNLT